MTFYGEEKIPHEAGHHAHESPRAMTGPLCVLAVCALVVGAYCELTHSFAEYLHETPSLKYGPVVKTAPESEQFNITIAQTSTGIAILGICLAACLYLGTRTQAEWLAKKLRPAYALSYGKFFIDQVYVALIVKPLEILATILYWLDQYLVDGLVNFVGAIPPLVGSMLRGLQAGLVQSYALLMIVGGLIAYALLMRI
jgi:NADH-quinone oxidoreductase subunit L